jgi:transposase-like protein
MAVERMETCDDVGELARELGVRPRCLYKWRRKLEMVEAGQEASRPSVVVNSPLGTLARLGLARAYNLLGENAKSRAAYEDFFHVWRDADPDIPILKAAKAEYAKLQ